MHPLPHCNTSLETTNYGLMYEDNTGVSELVAIRAHNKPTPRYAEFTSIPKENPSGDGGDLLVSLGIKSSPKKNRILGSR